MNTHLDVCTAHLGGFLMGLLVGTTFYPVISTSRRHKLIMWAFRLAALPIVIILFVLLTRNFYTSDPYAGALFVLFDLGQFNDAIDIYCSLSWVSISLMFSHELEQSL